MTSDRASKAGSNTIKAALLIVLALIAVACVQPANFGFLLVGLDASWRAASSYAVEKGLSFGSEIVFTSGPLSALYHRIYPFKLAPVIVALDVIWAAVFIVQLWKIFTSLLEAKAKRLFLWLSLAFLVVIAPQLLRDGLMLFFIFCTTYLYSIRKAGTSFLIASIIVTAALCMAKFSMNALALPALVIVDLLSLSRRQIPYKTAVFLLCLAGLFVVSGQPLSGLPDYFQASLEVSSGYSAAMSIDGSWRELLGWLATASMTFSIVLLVNWPAMTSGGLDRWTVVVQSLLLVGYFLVLLKAGFVRHDAHSYIAWSALFLAIPLLATTCGAVRWKYDPLFVPLVICFIVLFVPYAKQSRWNAFNPVGIVDRSIASIQTMARFVGHPRRWMADNEFELKASQERIRLQANMPYVSGSVDVIPSRQSEVIASGLDYTPRPTIQEYTAYSRALIERDRAFFRSIKAPDYVFFAPGSIDGRHPASAEGPLWPLLLQRYEPFERRFDLLVLRKRPQPLPDLLKEAVVRQARLGEPVVVPPTSAPMFVKIDVKYNVLGRVAELLFKPPNVTLRATYDGGSTEQYRLIPGIAREGSVLVPTVRSPFEFLQLYSAVAGNSPRPIAFEVEAAGGGAWAYQSGITISFAEIDTDILKAGGSLPNAGQSGNSRSGLDTIVDTNQLASPLLVPSQEGIFAHAPSQLVMDTGEAASIDLGFGIRDGAWQGEGAVKGVCFSILGEGSQLLFSRCLDPRAVVGDRGPQSAHVLIPPGTARIKLNTICVKTCEWAWSYWSKAELAPASR
ncbi:hypothetical protein [Bradyrhizobium sp.]